MNATPDASPSFWCRQFAPQLTRDQIAFDVAFGIVLPVVCLCLDPIVFRASFGVPLLNGYQIAAGGAIGLGFLALATWLTIRRPAALLAGLLAGGAVFASLLGLVLLPLSIIGLVAVIGILGFSPLVTAFVFWRNAVRAFRTGQQAGRGANVLAVLGLAVACGGPWAAQGYVTHETSRAFAMVQSADPTTAAQGLALLQRFHLVAYLDRLVIAYESENDERRRERLAEVYRELTGADVESRLAVMRD